MQRRDFLKFLGIGASVLTTKTYFDMGKNLWRIKPPSKEALYPLGQILYIDNRSYLYVKAASKSLPAWGLVAVSADFSADLLTMPQMAQSHSAEHKYVGVCQSPINFGDFGLVCVGEKCQVPMLTSHPPRT